MHQAPSDGSQGSYPVGEEIVNSISHGIALIVFAALYGDAWRIVSFSIYSVTLVILYLASTLFIVCAIYGSKESLRFLITRASIS